MHPRLPAKLFALACLLSPSFGQSVTPPTTPAVAVAGQRIPVAPATPVLREPSFSMQVVNGSDVHMETAPMSDVNPTDTHFCTDWEIWLVSPPERVWFADCVTGPEKAHAHFGDGIFLGSHAGFDALLPSTAYNVRARHRDSTLLWSPFAERLIETAPLTAILPMEEDDAAQLPVPTWRDESGADIELPFGAQIRGILVEAADVGTLFGAAGRPAPGNNGWNLPELSAHGHVRVRVTGGLSLFATPPSELRFTNHEGDDRTIYLPALNLGANESALFWISASGGSYIADPAQVEPDFSVLARSAPVPWSIVETGFQIDVFATGLRMPVNLAFVANPGTQPGDPRLYVAELYGTVKVITNDGTISDYATGLLNFMPSGAFPGSGELGLSGLVVEPVTGDVIVGYLASPTGIPADLYPRVMRLASNDGGMTATTQSVLLDLVGETQGQSHFISNLTIGPDGKLYVHLGDGFDATTALDLDSYRGKILRVNMDGSAPSDNPFAGGPATARDYVFAYGLRNPFGGDWWNGQHWFVENGPGSNDRLAHANAGDNFGWDGNYLTMTTGAAYNWSTPHGPVNIAFVHDALFGGSGFPVQFRDRAYVTESGPTWSSGPQLLGKRVVAFVLSPGGSVLAGPDTIVEYVGSGKASAVGLAAGPDGLYFTDFYKDVATSDPTEAGANILRLRFVGSADFDAFPNQGTPPLVVQFINTSNVSAQTSWAWDFGDGATSAQQSPYHIYTQTGAFNVRLVVTGANGVAVEQQNSAIYVGQIGTGLQGEYFNGTNFQTLAHSRLDPGVNFQWGTSAPAPGVNAEQFSVRWTGNVQPLHTETYTFSTTTDDGARLWIDGNLIVDQWNDQSATTHSGSIDLIAGRAVEIQFEMYDGFVDAAAILEWESFTQPRQVIPAALLFP